MDMEALLTELLSVNREMLRELRQLRQTLCQDAEQPQPGVAAGPGGQQVSDAAKARETPPRYTPKDLEGIGGAKLTQAPPRYTPKDLEDIGSQIMGGLKKRNRDADSAFSEFEKRRKDW